MEILNKLIWQGKSKWQIIGASIGAFLGMFMLLASIQLYHDMNALLSSSDGNFVQINKRVNLFNTLGVSNAFVEPEIRELKNQDFVEEVGAFSSNQFKVNASSTMMGFYTELFFESLPAEFVDTEDPAFAWKKGQRELPIILSRDYLALYNFGFAPSQGLPQFTPSTIRKVTLDINVQGNGIRKTYIGRIIGFSDRINSVLVPQSFMNYANKNFGTGKEKGSSRLILAVNNPLSQEMKDFFESKNYEVSSGRLIGGEFTALLNTVVLIIALIGGIIVLLSILIFVMNFQLLIANSKEDIKLLLQLGYKQNVISKTIYKRMFVVFGAIAVLTFALIFAVRYFLAQFLSGQGYNLTNGLHWQVYLAGLLFILMYLFINFRTVKSSVAKLF